MQKIDAQQLNGMKEQRDDFLLVNTLPEQSFEKTKIEGAINIPESKDDFVEKVEKKADSKKTPVVVYCANEACDSSVKAAEKLDKAGFEQVFEFTGGAEAWQQYEQASAAR